MRASTSAGDADAAPAAGAVAADATRLTRRPLAGRVVVGMTAGVALGCACHGLLPPHATEGAATGFALGADTFIRLIKMLIAPLVLTTLVTGIGRMGDGSAIGRIGARTLAWFLLASIGSLGLGWLMAWLIQPGAGQMLAPDVGSTSGLPPADAISLTSFVAHIVPISIVDAMARNEILQIVVFAALVGAAITLTEDGAPQVVELCEQVSHVMLKVTDFVMRMAPLAIFFALARVVTVQGPGILLAYVRFAGGFYLTLALIWTILLAVGFLVMGRRLPKLLHAIREAVLIAFSCASSEAALPTLLTALPTVGIPRRIASFVVPLGYSFNLDGTMAYCTFGLMFILQAHGVVLGTGQTLETLLLMLLMSKGVAGIPGTSLVVIMAALASLGLPPEWIALVLGVDRILDMGRAATNMVGNSLAAAAVAGWETPSAGEVPIVEEAVA